MNKSQRIYLNTGDTGNQNQDKYIKVKLEQDVETLEFMSLKIGTADVYQNFNADYGVLVGRVVANNDIGIPNARISIFIPLSDDDATNSDIYSVYPYKTPRDVNNEGKRYNLLPRVAIKDPDTGIVTPKQPFGSFPIKEEVVGNEPFLDVYKKYYKYTTLTNNSGDYMIFGVPVGTQVVHMSIDITDIGDYSMTPATMVDNLGYPETLFNEDKTEILPETNLDDLVNIETQEISVDIIPFWGDTENFEIGITRQDFRTKAKIVSTFSIFGSAFTDHKNEFWASQHGRDFAIRQLYRTDGDGYGHIQIATKQVGLIEHKIYYYPPEFSDDYINNSADPINDMKVLDEEEYTVRKENGDFVFIINCNRKKVITDESGELVPVPNDFNGGIFTEFRGFMTLEIPTENAPLDIGTEKIDGKTVSALRFKLKIPQQAPANSSFSKTENTNTTNWRKQHKIFKRGEIYSVARFNATVANSSDGSAGHPNENNRPGDDSDGFMKSDRLNDLDRDPYWNTGVITTHEDDDQQYEFPSNGITDVAGVTAFGGNWLNFSIYLPHFGYFKSAYEGFLYVHSSTNFTVNFRENTTSPLPYKTNSQDIAAGVQNTRWFARSDLNYTDFITVPKTDIIKMIDKANNKKGFKKSELAGVSLDGDYRNGQSPCPKNGGKLDGVSTNGVDPDIYFYRGFGESDCFRLLQSLGLV